MREKYYLTDRQLIMSNEQTLPNNTSVDSTNIVYLSTLPGALMKCVLVAETDITVSSGQELAIALEVGSTTTQADAHSPLFYNSSGVKTPSAAPKYIIRKISTDTAITFKAGDRISEDVIVNSMTQGGERYVQLKYTTNYDASALKVSAYLARV